jgi:hypothetical protein
MNGMMTMQLFRRRKYIIDSRLQLKILVISLCYVLFFFIVLIVSLYSPLIPRLNRTAYSTWESVEAAKQILFLHKQLWPASLLGLIAISIHSIITSHRIVGPLYRFRRILTLLRNGIISRPVILRRRDFLKTEMKAVNDMLESLHLRFSEIKTAEFELSKAIEACNYNSGSPNEISTQMAQIRVLRDQLSEKISGLKHEL